MPINLMSNGIEIIVGLCLVLILISIILHGVALKKISNQKKKFQAMMSGTSGENIQEELIKTQSLLQDLLKENEALKAQAEANHSLFTNSLQRVALHRFTAFDDMGGDTSYALALLNNNLDGVIISSIHSRQECRSYAKPVTKGQSSYQLSQEEAQVLAEACK